MGELGLHFLGEGRAFAISEVEGVSKVEARLGHFEQNQHFILIGVRYTGIQLCPFTGKGVK